MRYCLNQFPVLWFFCWGTILIPTLCDDFTKGGNGSPTERAATDVVLSMEKETLSSLKELVQFENRNQRSTSGTISAEDLQKLKGIERYYQRVLSGEIREKPDPKVIEKHRIVLESIFNQLAANTKDRKPNLSIKGLLSSLSNFTERGNPILVNSSTATTVDKDSNSIGKRNQFGAEVKEKNVSIFEIQNIKDAVTSASKQDHRNVIHFNIRDIPQLATVNRSSLHVNATFPPKNSLPIRSHNSELHLEVGLEDDLLNGRTLLENVSRNKTDSKDLSNIPIPTTKNISISKRYGEIYDSQLGTSAWPLSRLPGQTSFNQFLGKQSSPSLQYPQSPSRVAFQPTALAHPLGPSDLTGSLNRQTTFQVFPQATENFDSAPESPLAVTDVDVLQGDVTQALLEVLLRSNHAASASDYNRLLENMFSVLSKPVKTKDILFVDNFNLQDNTAAIKPPGLVSLQSQYGPYEAISPEALTSLLVRLQPPLEGNSGVNTTRISVPDIRQAGLSTLAMAISALIMSISTALSMFITDISAALMANPLLGVLAALALCALAFHIYKHKYKKKKKYPHKGYGHDDHHDDGYHRRNWFDEYRMFDADTEVEIVADILCKIDQFEKLLISIKDVG